MTAPNEHHLSGEIRCSQCGEATERAGEAWAHGWDLDPDDREWGICPACVDAMNDDDPIADRD